MEEELNQRALDVAMDALRKVKCYADVTSFFEKATNGEIDIRYLEKDHIKQVLKGSLMMKMLCMLDDGKGTLFG